MIIQTNQIILKNLLKNVFLKDNLVKGGTTFFFFFFFGRKRVVLLYIHTLLPIFSTWSYNV